MVGETIVLTDILIKKTEGNQSEASRSDTYSLSSSYNDSTEAFEINTDYKSSEIESGEDSLY